MQVLDVLDLLVERSELMEVGREEAKRVDLRRDVPVRALSMIKFMERVGRDLLGNSPGETEPVIGGRS